MAGPTIAELKMMGTIGAENDAKLNGRVPMEPRKGEYRAEPETK